MKLHNLRLVRYRKKISLAYEVQKKQLKRTQQNSKFLDKIRVSLRGAKQLRSKKS